MSRVEQPSRRTLLAAAVVAAAAAGGAIPGTAQAAPAAGTGDGEVAYGQEVPHGVPAAGADELPGTE
ncbi:peptidase C39 family protein, partial [Streptomyces sp. NPDC052535]